MQGHAGMIVSTKEAVDALQTIKQELLVKNEDHELKLHKPSFPLLLITLLASFLV